MLMCLYHFLWKECPYRPECTPDVDQSHHPNNTNCEYFIPVNITEFKVEDNDENSNHEHGSGEQYCKEKS